MRILLTGLIILTLAGCAGTPKGVEPVSGFELQRYLGTWYEIARLDHSFERGLSNVTAEYSMRDDGGVKVINRGYSASEERWEAAEGKAYLVDSPDAGHLKVSFFGPFYGAYVIMSLDKENYQYSLVSGPDRNYLWILSRTPALPDKVMRQLLAKAEEEEFPVKDLIYVEQAAFTE